MDEGLRYTGMVLIDIQKAFDTVDYTILTKKLNAIGVDDSTGSWFMSYMAGRKQVVKVNESTAGKIMRNTTGFHCGPAVLQHICQ